MLIHPCSFLLHNNLKGSNAYSITFFTKDFMYFRIYHVLAAKFINIFFIWHQLPGISIHFTSRGKLSRSSFRNSQKISIHSLLAEGDEKLSGPNRSYPNFNPLPPRRGRRCVGAGMAVVTVYFNPLPPRRGRQEQTRKASWTLRFQSTPSSQRETAASPFLFFCIIISIHSLLAEGDTTGRTDSISVEFQSTPSSQRETIFIFLILLNRQDFNPLPPRRGRLLL